MGRSLVWPSSVLDSPRPYQYLAAVIDAGGISAAAREVKASQAAVSAALTKLEEALNITLVVREGRSGSHVTPEGQAVADCFRRFEAQAQEFDAAVRAVQYASPRRPDALALDSGDRLRIAASTTTSEQLVPRWLRLLELSHEGVPVSLLATRSDKVIEAVQQDRVDIGFIANVRQRQKPKDLGVGVVAENVGGDEVVLVVSPEHRWAQRAKQKISILELLEEPQVAREPGSGALEVVEESLSKSAPGRRITVPFTTNSSVALRQAVSDYIRPAFLSSMAVVDQLATGELVKIGIQGLPRLTRARHAIWKEGRETEMMSDLVRIASQNSTP